MRPYFQDESCTIYHGDCREVLPSLPVLDCVVTSPPYNQLGSRIPSVPTGLWAQSSGGKMFVESLTQNGYADDMPEPKYQQWQVELFSELTDACGPEASLFYNHQIRWRDSELIHPVAWFKPEGWQLRQEIVWDRGGGMMMNARMFCRFDERVLWFDRGRHKWNQKAVGFGTVWRIAREQHKEHPVQFPVEIPARCIAAATNAGDIVLDPFMGSGTTGVACVIAGRKFIGVELEERFCDLAVARIKRASGEWAEIPRPVRRQIETPLFGGHL